MQPIELFFFSTNESELGKVLQQLVLEAINVLEKHGAIVKKLFVIAVRRTRILHRDWTLLERKRDLNI